MNWVGYRNPFVHTHTHIRTWREGRASKNAAVDWRPCIGDHWRIQSRTSFNTASVLVSTARKPFVKSCVKFSAKTFTLNSSVGGRWPFIRWSSQVHCWIGRWLEGHTFSCSGESQREVLVALLLDWFFTRIVLRMQNWREATDFCRNLRQKAIWSGFLVSILGTYGMCVIYRVEVKWLSLCVRNLYKLLQSRHKCG